MNHNDHNEADNAIDSGLNQLPQPPAFNPWKAALSSIAWGLFLTHFTLNFWMLNLILPICGKLMIAHGVGQFRGENAALERAWKLTVLILGIQVVGLGLLATPLGTVWAVSLLFGLLVTAVELLLLWWLREGFSAVLFRNGLEQRGDPLKGLLQCGVVILAVAATPLRALPIVALLGYAVFGLYYWQLYRLGSVGGQLEGADFPQQGEGTLLSGRAVALYAAGCTLLVALCCIVFNLPPLRALPLPVVTETATRAHLMELGFPKQLLDDLDDADLAHFEGALRVKFMRGTFLFGSRGMLVNSVITELPEQQLIVLHVLRWREDGGAIWQDGFWLDADGPAIERIELLGGRILYEQKGESCAAELLRLRMAEHTEQDLFSGARQQVGISGGMRFPAGSTERRAYVLHRAVKSSYYPSYEIYWNALYVLNRTHPFQVPYMEPEAYLRSEAYRFSGYPGWNGQAEQYTAHYEYIHMEEEEPQQELIS